VETFDEVECSDTESEDVLKTDLCVGCTSQAAGACAEWAPRCAREPRAAPPQPSPNHVPSARPAAPLRPRSRFRPAPPPSDGGGGDALDRASSTALVTAAIVLAVVNRVMYKISLVPLKDYAYFLSQFTTLAYLATYFTVLGARRRAGLVTAEMLAVPRRRLWAVGALDAAGLITGMVAAASLPGVVLPLLSQTAILWQVVLGRILLGKRLVAAQILGVLCVVGGVVVVAWPSQGSSALGLPPQPLALMVVSMMFPALSSIGGCPRRRPPPAGPPRRPPRGPPRGPPRTRSPLPAVKEGFFRDAKERLGGPMDIFVVNSYGSLAQAAFTLALLPVTVSLRGMSLGELPAYLAQGAVVFSGAGGGWPGLPLAPLLYVAANLAMNVTLLAIVRKCGALVVSLVMSALVPITVFAFTLPLPLVGANPMPVGGQFLAGCGVILAGLVLYNWEGWGPAVVRALGGGGGGGREKAA